MDKNLIFLLLCIWAGTAQAQWSNDPSVNTVLDKPGDQRAPVIAADGHSGAIVAWDEADGVFANHIDRLGLRQWGQDGIRITPPGRTALVTNIISDGQGGAVVVWEDLTKARDVGSEVSRIIENEMYVQRIDSNGNLRWPDEGVGVRTKIDSTTIGAFNIVSSDFNDFALFWTDDRKHPFPETGPFDFYAQKVSADGIPQWQNNGNLISVQGSMHNPRYRIAADGAGGFLLAHFDNDPMAQQATVVERISAEGELLWQPGGVPVHTGGAFELVTDGHGGAIVAGVYVVRPQVGQVRIQRVDDSGQLLWGDTAKVIMDETDLDTSSRIVHDGQAGVYIYWDAKDESAAERKGFLQHFDGSGSLSWSPMATRYNVTSTIHPIFISDQQNGVILLAIDFFETPEWDFWAFKVGLDGVPTWGNNGVLFRKRGVNDWPFYFDVAEDGSGGFIACWEEFQDTTSYDAILQQVSRNGELGEVITAVEEPGGPLLPEKYILRQNYPNPFNPETTITFSLSSAGPVLLRIYDLKGREVTTLVNERLSAAEHRATWLGLDNNGNSVASGVYFYRLAVNGFQAVRKLVLLR